MTIEIRNQKPEKRVLSVVPGMRNLESLEKGYLWTTRRYFNIPHRTSLKIKESRLELTLRHPTSREYFRDASCSVPIAHFEFSCVHNLHFCNFMCIFIANLLFFLCLSPGKRNYFCSSVHRNVRVEQKILNFIFSELKDLNAIM